MQRLQFVKKEWGKKKTLHGTTVMLTEAGIERTTSTKNTVAPSIRSGHFREGHVAKAAPMAALYPKSLYVVHRVADKLPCGYWDIADLNFLHPPVPAESV
jgi:hypothetical protein